MSNIETLLNAMGSIGKPFELFEPYLYKDKLGSGLWRCEIISIHGRAMWEGEGDTPEEAVQTCYDDAMDWLKLSELESENETSQQASKEDK